MNRVRIINSMEIPVGDVRYCSLLIKPGCLAEYIGPCKYGHKILIYGSVIVLDEDDFEYD